MLHALLIDDDLDFLSGLAEIAREEGYAVAVAGSLQESRAHLARESVDVALVDLALPDGAGTELLKELRELPGTDVIIISGRATVDSAIEALRYGALDYLTKPLDTHRLRAVLANAARVRALKEEVGSLRGTLRSLGIFGRMVGQSARIQHVYDLITRVAPTSATVFVTGESGTGKELVAQAIVELSPRRHKPFLPLDCGSISPTLIESELFGHERGSFTGAGQQRRGLFERASGGTLFLDEITEMPIELQVKLLRVLESGMITRVGGDTQLPVNVRLLAASNRPPMEAIRAKRLREDLFYRLNVFPIALPPLRDREGDALLLAAVFLKTLNDADGTTKRFSARALERIQSYAWPGNVRELKNEVQRSFILSDDLLEFEGLAPGTSSASRPSFDGAPAPEVGGSLDDSERRLIIATLDHCGGDKKRASEMLGISLKTLYNRLNQYASK